MFTFLKKLFRPRCAACNFEQKYGTKDNPRPIHDLKIHTCSQVTCPMCAGYTVINGAPAGMFAVFGGDPCPLCNKTGRVTAEVNATYVHPCPGMVQEPLAKFVLNTDNVRLLPCALEQTHKGECQAAPIVHLYYQLDTEGFITYCGKRQKWCRPKEYIGFVRVHANHYIDNVDCPDCRHAYNQINEGG